MSQTRPKSTVPGEIDPAGTFRPPSLEKLLGLSNGNQAAPDSSNGSMQASTKNTASLNSVEQKKVEDQAWSAFLSGLRASTYLNAEASSSQDALPERPGLLSIRAMAEKLEKRKAMERAAANYPTPGGPPPSKATPRPFPATPAATGPDEPSASPVASEEPEDSSFEEVGDYADSALGEKRRRSDVEEAAPKHKLPRREPSGDRFGSPTDLAPSDSVSNAQKKYKGKAKATLSDPGEEAPPDAYAFPASGAQDILPDVGHFRRRLSMGSRADSLRMECALVDSAIELLGKTVKVGGSGLDLLDTRARKSESQQAVQTARQIISDTLMTRGFPAAQQLYSSLQLMVFDDLRNNLSSQLSRMAMSRQPDAFESNLTSVNEEEEEES